MATITVTQSGTTVVVENGDKVIIDIPGGGDVTIVADPDDNVDKVKIEFVDDTQADTVNIDLSTFSEDGLHIDIFDYDPTDTITLQGAFNRYVDPDDTDEYTFDYIGADGQTYTGFVHAKDKDEKDFLDDPAPIIICFARGTEIETASGARRIETLRIGDLVQTLDAGLVPVKWLGRTDLGPSDLTRWGELLPVRVRRGALAPGRPARDVVLSPNHRVLVTGWRAEILFGEPEVLVPVKALVDGAMITQDTACTEVSYYHLLLESHEIVETSGLLSESLFLSDQSLQALSGQSMEEMRGLLNRADWQRLSQTAPARPLVRARLGKCLAA